MANPSSVSELVLRWQELRDQGHSISAEELCADSPEQLEELKRQIEALQSMQQFLDTPAGGAPSAATPGSLASGCKAAQSTVHLADDAVEPQGDEPLVGLRYRPLRLHAKGGLGEVFVARDEELSREVALKRIRRPHAEDDDSRRRFLREGEITGSLEHPGVVPVYGLTRDASGQPCYAMRFIRGQTLQEAIARFHEADQANRSLALRQLLSRFVAVCNTIAYAHSRGVVHRDLKPANIMLGDYGETLVVDWGLAKRLEDSGGAPAPGGDGSPHAPTDGRHDGTATGAVLGTPAFMSPEQAAGRSDAVGPASDVYGLGATLYALLTGRPPFSGDSVGAVLYKVERGDFPPPRQLRPDTPRALEAICLKAMAREPAARYTTALELAADLEHWLADEPVRAYPEPWTGRMRRWLRRHRGLTASAAGLLVASVAALAIGIVIVNQEKNHTEQEKLRAERALTAETAAWKRTREALNTLTDDVMEELLGKQAALGEKEKAFLRKALGFYEQFAAERSEDEEARAVAAEGQFRVAKLRSFLGESTEALEGYRAAMHLYEKLADDFPTVPQYRLELARSRGNMAIRLANLGKSAEAEAEYRQTLALLEQMAGDFLAVPEYRRYLASTHHGLGSVLRGRGEHAEAKSEYHQALALQEKLVKDFPTVPDYRLQLASIHVNLGALLVDLGEHAEAEAQYHQALALQEKLVNDFPTVPDYRRILAYSYHDLALLLANLDKRAEAEKAHRQALALREKLAGEFPAVPHYRLELARSHGNLGRLLRGRLDRGAEAETEYHKALALLEKLVTDFPGMPSYRAYLAYHSLGLGILLANLSKPTEAEKAYRQAIARLDKLAGEYPAVPEYRDELAHSHNSLGNLLQGLGKATEAESAYHQALALRKKLADDFPAVPGHRQGLAGSYVNFGNLLLARCQPQAALDWYAKALPLLQTILASDARIAAARQYLRNAHWGRAQALAQLGQHAESARDWQRAAELDNGPSRSILRLQQSAALARAGKHPDAVKAVEEVLASTDPKGKAPPSVPLLYNAACVYALSAAAVKDEAKLREQYAARAVALLRQAQTAGFFKDAKRVENFKKDNDLNALRQRDDYRKFVAELAEESKSR